MQAGQPIHFAALGGHTELIQLLVERYEIDPGSSSEVHELACMIYFLY